MSDLARHQKPEGLLHAGIVGEIDEALVDDLGPRLGRDVGAQVGGGLADAVDVGGCPGDTRGVHEGRTAPLEHLRQMAVVACAGDAAIELALHGASLFWRSAAKRHCLSTSTSPALASRARV